MSEPTIICPSCKTEIRLTESLAAPLLATVREDYEARLARKDEAVAEREAQLRKREQAVAEARQGIEDQVEVRIQDERKKIAQAEARKARLALAGDLDEKIRELTELQEVLKERDRKLAEAQQAQADLIRKQRELDDARRELELTVEKKVQAGLEATREQTRVETEDRMRQAVAQREQTIQSMQRQIEDLKRKAEQGSQQVQGEVQELELEAMLRSRFPQDAIEPVPKGEFGGDIIQRVFGPLGQQCGTILWECKRTKNWSEGWLAKLRDDQRAAKAEIAILVSQALPREVELFDVMDGVWVAAPKAALPVALSLRQTLIEVAQARQAGEGQQSKMEMVYEYLTGPRFRLRMQAIIEAFTTMQEDLDREKRAILKHWAKREEQILRVNQAAAGMYGDLQGIAGRSLQEIEGLAWKALESGE